VTDGEGEEVPRSWGARGRRRVSAAGRALAGRRIASASRMEMETLIRCGNFAASAPCFSVCVPAVGWTWTGACAWMRVSGVTQRALDTCGGTCCYHRLARCLRTTRIMGVPLTSALFYFGRVFWYRLSTFILILVLVTHTLKEMCTPYLIGMVNIYTATLAMEKYGGPAT
jgi:hypothetical protein